MAGSRIVRERRGLRALVAIAAAVALSVPALDLSGSAGAAPAPLPITGAIDWNDVRQEIDGFGGSGAFQQAAALQKLPAADQQKVLDLLFSQTSGAGLSLVRNLVPNIASVPGVYNFTGDQDQKWLMTEAMKRGTNRFMGTVWSPPAYMKDNFKVCCGGSVPFYNWTAYADYLAKYANEYTKMGYPIYAVSPANEPDASTDYDSSRWTGAQFRDFIKTALRPVWEAQSVQAKLIIPESSYWGEDMAAASLDDPDFTGIPSAGRRVDIVAAHGYGRDNPPGPLPKSRAAGKKIWQTETSELGIAEDASISNGLFTANRMHDFLTGPEVNLYNHWWLVTEKRMPDGKFTREALINLNTTQEPFTFSTTKRLFAMGQWSRFVRPGWVRVGASGTNARVTAFRDPSSGRFAVVAINSGSTARTERLKLNGFSASSVTPYTTSSSLSLTPGASVDASTGIVDAVLPARSITTFVGDGAANSPLVATVTSGKVWTGETLGLTATVRNAGTSTVTATIEPVAGAPLSVSPASATATLAPGQSTSIPLEVSAPAGASGGAQPVQVFVTAAGSTEPVVGFGSVSVSADQVRFVPNTVAERPWLADAGGSQINGPVEDGNARFTDGGGTATYRFDLPKDVTGGSLALDIGNQFKVDTSTDGSTWTNQLTETADVRDLSNRAVRSLDLDAVRDGGTVVWVRMADSQPANGWGAWLASAKLDVVRSPASAAVTLDPTTVVADGASTSTASVTVVDAYQHPVADQPVSIGTTDDVTFVGVDGVAGSSAVCTTDAAGTCSVGVVASTTAGAALVVATAAAAQASATLTEVAGPPARVSAVAEPAILRADGRSLGSVVLGVTDTSGNAVAGQDVSVSSSRDLEFSTDGVTFGSSASCTTTTDGTCVVTVRASHTRGVEVLTATSGALTGQGSITEIQRNA